MALVIGNLYINPISTFNPNSSKVEGKKNYTYYKKNLTVSSRCNVVSFRVIASIMENLDINPISTFNPISTKGEGKQIKPITTKVLQLSLDVML